MLGHKESLGKFKKTEVISSNFSNHNAMGLEINNEKNYKKTQTLESKNYATKQPVNH